MNVLPRIKRKLRNFLVPPEVAPPGQHRLLFVFQGRMGQWDGMGHKLYRRSKTFRQTVAQCSALIEERNGVVLEDAFKSIEASALVNQNEFQAITTHALIHLGLSNYWLEQGVLPDATIGLSLGEITSAYINKSLSLEDTMAVARSVALWDERLPEKGRLIIAQTGLKAATQLARSCPVHTEVFGELGPKTTLLFTAQEDVDTAARFLQENNCEHFVYARSSAYHTERFAQCKPDMLKELAHIQPGPSQHPIYSGLSGSRAPDGLYRDANFYYWMTAKPTLFNSAFEKAIADGFDTILNIGPHPALTDYMQEAANRLGKNIVILDSMRNDESEMKTLRRTLAVLKQLGLVKSNADAPDNSAPDDAAPDNSAPDDAARDLPYPFSAESDPYLHYRKLREQAPVHYFAEQRQWFVLDYNSVASGLKQTNLFSSEIEKGIDYVLVNSDPPDHTRARRLLAPYFAPQQMAQYSQFIEEKAEELLATATAAATIDKPLDIVFDFAVPLTELAMAHILDLNQADQATLRQLAGSDLFQLEISATPFGHFFQEYLADENKVAENRLCRQLLNNGDNSFNRDEVASLMKLFWIAGTTTTSMLISTAVKTLLYHPAVRFEISENQDLIPQFIEEVLRYDTPQRTTWRVATADTTIADAQIKAGEMVRFCLAAANHDETYFKNAQLFNLFRQPKEHLSFGHGMHACIGAYLSRMEARIAISTLIRRLPQMSAMVGESDLKYVPTDDFRALTQLLVNGQL
jgi:cytochrome P450